MEYLTSVGLPIVEDADHRLLDVPVPDYTVATVRRAFIVWLYCGQKNRFRDVCDYYHRLEMLEETMSPEQRAASRHHEFTLFSQQPPTSDYLKKHYPTLYTQTHIENHYLRKIEAIQNQCVYENLTNKTTAVKGVSGYSGASSMTSGPTKQEIVDASQTIKNYCLQHKLTLKEFLESFKEYAQRCRVKYTIANIEAYIKTKMAEKELDMVVECSELVKKESVINSKVNEKVIEVKCKKHKTVDDECRNIAESTVKHLIDFNDVETKNKVSKKKSVSAKNDIDAKTHFKMNKDAYKENRVTKEQKCNGNKEDTIIKEALKESLNSIESCGYSRVNTNTGIKEVDINVNGKSKPVTLLKRDNKPEADTKLLNTSCQDLSFVKIQTK